MLPQQEEENSVAPMFLECPKVGIDFAEVLDSGLSTWRQRKASS